MLTDKSRLKNKNWILCDILCNIMAKDYLICFRHIFHHFKISEEFYAFEPFQFILLNNFIKLILTEIFPSVQKHDIF